MVDETSIPWPKKRDVAFGEGPCPDFSLPTITCIDCIIMQPNLLTYADSFREAADMLIDSLSDERYPFPPDKLFLPISYLYRHAIELLLKEAVEYALRIGLIDCNERTNEVLGEHNLYKVWNILKPAIMEFWTSIERDSIQAVESIVNQFHKLDRSGQSFRYPKRTDGRPSFSNVSTPPREVDLLQLKEVTGGICNYLDGCISGFYDALSNMPSGEW